MAAPMELYCWAGGWGLPSVDPDCLAVLTYARFTGAPLKVHKITNPWRSPSGTLPALKSTEEGIISDPQQIITHLRKQKFNADYDLSARQAADTLAFVSLLQEKLLPVLIHTFWVDAKNYVEHTRKWYAEAIPFPLSFFLPGRMQKRQLERLQSVCRDVCLESEEELEKELYREARECLTLLSQRLGRQKFFFGDAPASLDAVVFSHLAPLLKAKLPNAKFQQHLKSLPNLCNYCTNILSLYFPWDGEMGAWSLQQAGEGARPASLPLSSDSVSDTRKRSSASSLTEQGRGSRFLTGLWTPLQATPRPVSRRQPLGTEATLRRNPTNAGTRSSRCWWDWWP